MSINKKHIEDYLAGKLSPKEANALEKKALDDPFLYEAIQGFEENPAAAKQFLKKGKYTGIGLSLLVICVGIGITYLLLPKTNTDNEILVLNSSNDSIQSDEVVILEEIRNDKMDSSLEAMHIDESLRHLDANEVAQDQGKHYPIKNDLSTTLPMEDEEPIIIHDNEIPDPTKSQLSPEEIHGWGEGVPYDYLSNLYVVDYRKIERVKNTVSYKRMELGGTSAAFESEEMQANNELIEVEVKVSYWEYLGKAMQRFEAGDYKASLNQYLIILQQYPEDLNALFYGGLCFYNFGEFEKAIDYFEQIEQSDLNGFKEEALWYQAKSFIELGLTKEAGKILEIIIVKGGFYTEKAIQLKKRLH